MDVCREAAESVCPVRLPAPLSELVCVCECVCVLWCGVCVCVCVCVCVAHRFFRRGEKEVSFMPLCSISCSSSFLILQEVYFCAVID